MPQSPRAGGERSSSFVSFGREPPPCFPNAVPPKNRFIPSAAFLPVFAPRARLLPTRASQAPRRRARLICGEFFSRKNMVSRAKQQALAPQSARSDAVVIKAGPAHGRSSRSTGCQIVCDKISFCRSRKAELPWVGRVARTTPRTRSRRQTRARKQSANHAGKSRGLIQSFRLGPSRGGGEITHHFFLEKPLARRRNPRQ